MNNRRAIAHCLVAILWIFPATTTLAQEPLKWKFTDGQSLRYDITQAVTLSLPGGAEQFILRQQFELTWTVQAIDENGDETGRAEIEQNIERILLTLDSPHGVLEYDSANEEDPSGVAALAGPLLNALRDYPLRFELASNGKIGEVVVPEQLLETMRNSSFETSFANFISEAGLRRLLLHGIPVFPAEALSVGDTWTRTTEPIDLSLGPQVVELSYQYQGENDASLSRITSSRQISYADQGSEQPSIEDQDSSGEFLFDAAQGHLVRNQWSVKLRLKAPNDDELGEGTLDQSFEMELSDRRLDAGDQKTPAP